MSNTTTVDLSRRVRLACLPTPLHELPNLREALGSRAPKILIKRDDLTGHALGGNKSRKLEYLVADAKAKGATAFITCGAAQSNHALQSSAAAKRYGLDGRSVLFGTEDMLTNHPTGNVLLHSLLGSKIRWVQLQGEETLRSHALKRGLEEEEEAVRAEGGVPYVMPSGGSTPVGLLGYVNALKELMDQSDEAQNLTSVYFASGSAGTQAGLVVGARAFGFKAELIGVEVDPYTENWPAEGPTYGDKILGLTNAVNEMFSIDKFSLEDLTLNHDYAGPEYGKATPEAEEAIDLLAKTEGIFVDPVYTGKALSGLIDHVRKGKYSSDETILFWHTGGIAGLFAEKKK